MWAIQGALAQESLKNLHGDQVEGNKLTLKGQ
jgi:hypothetical protein